MSGIRIFGLLLVLVGAAAALFPNFFAPITRAVEPTLDLYEAVERRVRGGMVLSVGLILLAVPALRPWSMSISLGVFYFMLGALAARMLGIFLDGAVPKQCLLVGVEAVVMALAAFWLWRSVGTVPGISLKV